MLLIRRIVATVGEATMDLPFHSHNKNIMPLIPFSVPPHMEQPEAPLTAEEREKKIREQIEYYFSENNLCSDVYLKGWMNQQGWVPLTLVAGFPRVQALTTDYETVQRSVLSSTGVELQDSKIRRRMGWEKYILPISFTHEG
uniref:HTH La-type RNA-binding domain-containing protein n=1 Tax=Oryza rufipogon TaxID=4529 RepID=A0A0E0QZK9_ORYRU